MAPTPEDHSIRTDLNPEDLDGERIVISGMSGLYPNSNHVKDLEKILYDKINPISEENCRWQFTHPEVCNHSGKIPNLNRFDGQFFKVHYRMGNSMDAMGRKVLELSYQAIYDAGVCPEQLSGKKVGVYSGSCFSETEKAMFYVASTRTGFGIAGCSKSMIANRISYWLNGKGPSMSVDEACISSIVALEQAYSDLSRGECEAAIVASGHLSLHPQSTVHAGRIVTLSPDGKTKSFDQNADGCAKSEAINVLFLQKAKHAKRIYAEVIHVKSQFVGVPESETGPRYGFYREPRIMMDFIKQFYQEANVPPQAVEYVEAFGSATPEADKAELEAIEEVFCKDRSDPLLVGSVMSNIGYVEAASGLAAIIKVLLGYHNGTLAANLHCENPRQDVQAIKDGKIQILTDHKRFRRTLTAVNQISVTGCNGHVLLNGHYKPKDPNRYKASIPRLVTISGRQDTAVKRILEDLKSRPIDPEEHALFHNIHQIRISGHLGRGYIILDTNEEGKTVSLAETASYFDDAQRPLWFVYSGMGSQWAGMGAQLMRIPVFAAAIEKCQKALEPKGVDIVHIITSPEKTIFDNILHSFVGIAAVQIGLTDVLASLGIKPDMIIGHSVGELGCAYADGCFTAEEMILSAYSRGLVSVQTPFIKGSMAAVGIGYSQVINLVPPEIEVACHNGPESSTISGPTDKMKEFVAQLTAKGIFAKEVPCSNIAYHSRYISEAGPGLRKYLSEVIKNPKPRSEKWVSSSVPRDRWNEPIAKYSSAEYHTNNLLSPVLFEETSRLIPSNAVCIEIAPHALLQAILKRSLPDTVKNIALTRRGHPDNAFMVLDAIGKLYMEGFNPKVHNLYPKVEFPVSTGTPMLSHLVEWAHNEKWILSLYQNADRRQAATCQFLISPHDVEYNYLRGHVLRGKNVYPFSAALVAVWDTLAMSKNLKRKSIPVEFRDIHFYGQPVLHENRPLRLSVALHRANGRFEVLDENRKIVAGFVKSELHETKRLYQMPFESKEDLDLSADDVYQILYERDYFYTVEFRSIRKLNKSFTEAQIIWKNNWVTYLDGILQLQALKTTHNTVANLFQIRRICINIKEHFIALQNITDEGAKHMDVQVFETLALTRSGGVLVENVQFNKLPLLDEEPVALKVSKFIPRFKCNIDTVSAIQVYLQTVAENINKETINVLGIMNSKEDLPIFKDLKALNDIHGITVHYEYMRWNQVLKMRDQFLMEADLVLVQDLTNDDNLCQMLYRVLRRDTFLINEEEREEERIRASALFRVVSSHIIDTNNKKLDLVKWRPTQANAASTVVTCRNTSELELLKSTREDLPQRHKLVILASYPPVAGLKDMVKQWRKESDKNQIYLIMISEKDNLDQLPELDLAYNALVNGEWGNEYLIAHQEKVTVERGLSLSSSRIGDLDSLHWVEAEEPTKPGVAVNVHYAAINDKDVKKATGVISLGHEKEPTFGMDFSGVTDDGQRVMGLIPSGSTCSRIKARPEFLWPVPSHWSLEDAVTVPFAYSYAFYILGTKLKQGYKRGARILVHGATGALGQAIINVALAHNCEVFATVSDVKKKLFLMKLFPTLKEDHIGNSRDSTFGDMVRLATNDKCCNYVICCVSGDLKNVSLNCLSPCGIMYDLVQLSTQEPYLLGMNYLNRERNYVPLDFSTIFSDTNMKDIKTIQTMMSEGIARGYVRPLCRVTYLPNDVTRAFRLLAGSKHRGRVVLKLRDNFAEAEPRLWENQGVKVKLSSEDLSNNKGAITLLSESNTIAPVEGIYVVATDASLNNAEKLANVTSKLDLAARKLCPSVRYFAIVNAGLNVAQQSCLARASEGLPITQLNIPSLRKLDDVHQTSPEAVSWRGALKALERALRSSQTNLTAHLQKVKKPTLLQQIADIAEIEISEEAQDDITLHDLGLDLVKVPAIASYLKDTHNVVLIDDSIPDLTLKKITDLEEAIYGSEHTEVRGLEIFYNYVDPDELLATTEIAFLPTLTNSAVTRDDEFDVNETYIYLIPGLEGHHERFRLLCERLKLPAMILQPGLDHLQETPKELAERYATVLMQKARLRKNFYLLGYEAGVSIALEVAGILEDHGLEGIVYCVGNTPEEFQELLEKELQSMPSDEELQNAIASHMYKLMIGNEEGLQQALDNVSAWKDKLQICVRMLLGKLPHSAQYARNLLEAAYTRLKQARAYKIPPRELKSKLILLHAASMDSDLSPITSLQKYSRQPVIVHELKEPLAHATKDLQCSAIINKYLSPDLLEAFEERNLCDTYLLNGDQFMTMTTTFEAGDD